MQLGKNVTKFRIVAGLSQNALSKKLNLSNSTIIRLENGEMSNPSLSTLLALCNEFKVSLDALVGFNINK